MQFTKSTVERDRCVAVAGVLLGMAATLGCGSDRPTIAVVTGTVTMDGSPVPTGEIRFIPLGGRMAMGEIVDGKYSLGTFAQNDGALLGSHVVTITAMKIGRAKGGPPEPGPDASPEEIKAWNDTLEGASVVNVKWLVPERYSDHTTSGLTAEVEQGTNQIDFPLTTQ